jgi:hypothetical protein
MKSAGVLTSLLKRKKEIKMPTVCFNWTLAAKRATCCIQIIDIEVEIQNVSIYLFEFVGDSMP